MKTDEVKEDGFYIVDEPGVALTTRTIWRRETGESWDGPEATPRIMWFDCGDPSGTPMEAHLSHRVENAIVRGQINLPRGREPTITKFVT